MMSRIRIPTFVLFLVLLANIDIQCQAESFARPLSLFLTTRNEMVNKMLHIRNDVDQHQGLQSYIQALEDVERNGKEFMETELSTPVSRPTLLKLKEAISSISLPSPLIFYSQTLEREYERQIRPFWNTMTAAINLLLSVHDSQSVPFLILCPSRLSLKKISTTDVCKSSLSCATENKPYQTIIQFCHPSKSPQQGIPSTNCCPSSSFPSFEDDLQKACTNDRKCSVEKALPLMTGILWYEINYMILKKLCPHSCLFGTCKNDGDVLNEVRLTMTFASMPPVYFSRLWTPFFSDFQASKVFSEVELVLPIFEKYLKHFQMALLACTVLKFNQACPYSDAFKYYKLMKDVTRQKKKTVLVKDLRRYAQLDKKKVIEIHTNTMQHLEELAAIKTLGENLKTYVSGISKYFQGVAQFDEGIANADVAFIKGQLAAYETKSSSVEAEMSNKLDRAMGLMMGVLAANLAEKITILAFLICKQGNPFKAVFSGSDLGEIQEKLGEVADSASQLVKGSMLMVSLNELTQDSLKLYKAFNDNKQQLASLENVVDKIKNGHSSDIGEDAEKFIEQYNSYSPKVSRSDIAKNNALWSAFKDATCALLEGEVGVGGAVPKTIAGSELICERLEAIMAQFFTLREDIFDFQFQLVDAVTSVIRAYTKQRLAKEIKGKDDELHSVDVISAYMAMQLKLQTVASLYCDVLEYKNYGQSITACKITNGLFTKETLDYLISYKDTSPYTEVESEVYIPTRASFLGDAGYIDLAALGRGEEVIFKIPANDSWLQNYHWLLPGSTDVPFVEDLKVFLPHTGMPGGVLTTTQVTISSVAGSSFSTTKTNEKVLYMLPSPQTSFQNVYDEGYRQCSKKIENPYSLCNNLPKICDKSKSIVSQSIMPTPLSTWKIRLLIYQGANKVTWNTPNPATNLLIRAKVKLRFPRQVAKRDGSDVIALRSSYNFCCDGNRYRKSPYIPTCQPCPGKSQSKYRGLYCEIAEDKLLVDLFH